MIKAVLFDLDGVVADTDKSRFIILQELLSKRNLSLGHHLYKKSVGARTQSFLREVFGTDKLSDQDIVEIYNERKVLLHQNPQKYIVAQPGVVECCEKFHKAGITLAVASSSLEKEIKLVLENVGISEYFSVMVGSDGGRKPKPDPQIYLDCCAAVGFSPQECVAIEDSPRGVQSAQAAGCFCFAVTYTHDASELSAADQIISTLLEINPEQLVAL